jgi:hypothetical protein
MPESQRGAGNDLRSNSTGKGLGVLLELLGADSYEERTEGRDINIAVHSLILNQPTGFLEVLGTRVGG